MLRAKSGYIAWLAPLLLTSLAAAETPPLQSKADKVASRFVRVNRDKNQVPLALETSIVRCAPAPGADRSITVDLVAAIHIADPDYYKQLNCEFEGYDAVLYELVASEDSKIPQPDAKPGNHPVSLLQNGMKDILALEYQLKGIDYTRRNMVHADMSPDQFARSMQRRGETMTAMFARMMGYAMTQQGQTNDGARLLAALFDKNRALALKRAMAEQFESSEGSMAALEGPNGSTLVAERNKVALEVLRKEIAGGKKKFAIFYGAAHMPDFQKRLRDEFGMTPVGVRWLAAWTLKTEAAAKPR